MNYYKHKTFKKVVNIELEDIIYNEFGEVFKIKNYKPVSILSSPLIEGEKVENLTIRQQGLFSSIVINQLKDDNN